MLTRKVLASVLLSLSLTASALLVACSEDDDAGGDSVSTDATAGPDRAAAEEHVRSIIDAYNRGDIEAFLAGWTDEGLQAEFAATRDELMAAAGEFFGGPERQLHSVTATDANGDTVTVEAEFALGKSVSKEMLTLTRADGAWKIVATEPLQPGLASDVATVEVGLDEFSFTYDMEQTNSGNFAFRA